jgi:Membrane transporters of cations and cationic drugs
MKLILLYVMFSASGLLMLKIGTTQGLGLQISSGKVQLTVHIALLVGMCFYILSFILSLLAMKAMDLSVFYPVSAGLGYVLVCILSYAILKERITAYQLIGMLFILAGVILMNLKK